LFDNRTNNINDREGDNNNLSLSPALPARNAA